MICTPEIASAFSVSLTGPLPFYTLGAQCQDNLFTLNFAPTVVGGYLSTVSYRDVAIFGGTRELYVYTGQPAMAIAFTPKTCACFSLARCPVHRTVERSHSPVVARHGYGGLSRANHRAEHRWLRESGLRHHAHPTYTS